MKSKHRAAEDPAHEEDSTLVPAVEFPYHELDPAEDPADRSELSDQQMEAALRLFNVVMRWAWQDAMRNPDGLKIRAAILCWVFIPHLHEMTLTQLAGGFGLHKQSVGRWVDDFKVRFPRIRIPHMR